MNRIFEASNYGFVIQFEDGLERFRTAFNPRLVSTPARTAGENAAVEMFDFINEESEVPA